VVQDTGIGDKNRYAVVPANFWLRPLEVGHKRLVVVYITCQAKQVEQDGLDEQETRKTGQ
jgi:hypothetical protein